MPDRNLFGETMLAQRAADARDAAGAAVHRRTATYEVRFKQSHDWPLAFASVALTMSGEMVRGARIVMGAVAPIPWRSPRRRQH